MNDSVQFMNKKIEKQIWISPVPGPTLNVTIESCSLSLSLCPIYSLLVISYNPNWPWPIDHIFIKLLIKNVGQMHVRSMPPISQTGILGDNCPVIINWVLKNILTLMMNDTNFVAIRKRSALFNHTSDRLCITDKKKVNSWFINQMVNPWTTMQKTSTWSLITHLKPKIKTKKNIKSGILDADSL